MRDRAARAGPAAAAMGTNWAIYTFRSHTISATVGNSAIDGNSAITLYEDYVTRTYDRIRQILTQDLIICIDGLGQNGAAIYSPPTSIAKGEYIGTDDTHNLYAAELIAIQMAVALFEEKIDDYTNVYVFTENQFAIKAVEHPRRQSGQYIIKEILDTIG